MWPIIELIAWVQLMLLLVFVANAMVETKSSDKGYPEAITRKFTSLPGMFKVALIIVTFIPMVIVHIILFFKTTFFTEPSQNNDPVIPTDLDSV